MPPSIIDSHAHLGWDSFSEDRDQMISRAREAGVMQMINAGVDLKSIPEQLELADRYHFVYTGVGLHPHEAKDWDDNSADILRQSAKHKSVRAIGECGLDFFYNHSEKEKQLHAFSRQIELALELDLPIIIHTRDAWPDTFDLLFKYADQAKAAGRQLKGVFHCFTGGPEVIPRIKELDFYVSFSGIVTFKKSEAIQQAVPLVPKERILVETDSPYLAPQGHRGQRNEPAFIWKTVEKLAELRKENLGLTAEQTVENTRALFKLADSM